MNSAEPAVVVLPGSLRTGLHHQPDRRLAPDTAPTGVDTVPASALAELPFYNQDLDTEDPPPAVAALRRQVHAAVAVLVISPENNGSVSAVLKNAIDWRSRPRGSAALLGKPVALVVAGWSLSSVEQHLEQILTVAGAHVVPSFGRAVSVRGFRGQAPADAVMVRDAIANAFAALAEAS